MIKYNIVSIFLSNKNFELSFKLQKWCKELRINLVNVIDLLDLSLKIAQLKPAILLVDENYAKEMTSKPISLYSENMNFFEKMQIQRFV